jgi:hypothetical protein
MAKDEKPRDVQLAEKRMKAAEFVSTRWAVTLPPEHNHDDLMNPAYWAHVAIQMQPGNILEVRTDTGSHYGRFYVSECSRNHAKLHELEWVEIEKSADVDDDVYVYGWKGPVMKHCIIRKSDGAVIQEQMPTKAAAQQWILNERKAA